MYSLESSRLSQLVISARFVSVPCFVQDCSWIVQNRTKLYSIEFCTEIFENATFRTTKASLSARRFEFLFWYDWGEQEDIARRVIAVSWFSRQVLQNFQVSRTFLLYNSVQFTDIIFELLQKKTQRLTFNGTNSNLIGILCSHTYWNLHSSPTVSFWNIFDSPECKKQSISVQFCTILYNSVQSCTGALAPFSEE